MHKLEICISGKIETLNARVQYKNTWGNRKSIHEALIEWKTEYRHKLRSLRPLNLAKIISKKKIKNETEISKLALFVEIINKFMSQNTTPTTQPLNNNTAILNLQSPNTLSSSTSNHHQFQILQYQNQLLENVIQQQKRIKELEDMLQQQSNKMGNMQAEHDKMETQKKKAKKQASYYRGENKKKKVCFFFAFFRYKC